MNKLSKLIYLTSLMSLCALSAASCSTKQADIDISSLSSEFNESGIFSETLSDISQPIMEKRYGIEEGQIAEFKAGAGTKAVVDEYAIIKLSSPDAKENVENGIKSHIESQKNSYSSYKPDEVPKLDDYVLISSADYEIFVVSENSTKAKEIIDKYIK